MAEDTVWVPPARSHGSGGKNPRRYHTNRECRVIADRDVDPHDRHTVESRMGLECCQFCSGERTQTDTIDRTAYDALKRAAKNGDGGDE